jgi:hypothetical protein
VTTQAQPSPRFPPSQQVQIDGERHQAFDLGGFTELLRIDQELQAALLDVTILRGQRRWLEEQVGSLRTQLDVLDEQVRVLQQERERLVELWTEENRLRLLAENKPDISRFIGWTTAGLFGVATLVLAIILGISL